MRSLVAHTLAMLRNGRHDPTTRIEEDSLWRATITPHGAGTVCVTHVFSQSPHITHFGPGGPWLAQRALDLLGQSDHLPTITPHHQSVARAQRSFSSLLFPRTHSPYHELLPAVLGQRVTAIEAFSQWRELCHTYGSRAPGPRDDLYLPPDPDVLSRQPYYVLHRFGIEKRRADALRGVAHNAARLIRDIDVSHSDPSALTSSLTNLSGIGVWTAATAGGVAYGDPDALVIGDYHVKNTVAFALNGIARGTDDEMVALLSPYNGQRARVVKWLELDGWVAPKFGPRQRISSIVNR
jgi:3-methyladenine DNA glycosylase/8-oxoguanine DNA glycosylase